MHWLLMPATRPDLMLAALASLLLNLALLVPALYMLQVFDRVFSSRSIETLVVLGVAAMGALGLAFAMDRVRARLLARAGLAVDEALAGAALNATLDGAARSTADGPAAGALGDIGRLRQFLAGPAVQALFDAPWLPVHLLVIYALHPALGWAAAASAVCLLAMGLLSESRLRAPLARQMACTAAAAARVDQLLRLAPQNAAMGHTPQAVDGWKQLQQDARLAQQQVADVTATLSAGSRMLRQAVQVGMLGLGAWLVVASQASPGIMVATTVLLGRALAPVEQLLAGWRSLIEVRAAWRRLQQQALPAAPAAAPSLPAMRGAVQLERVSLLAGPSLPPVLKSVSLVLPAGQCLGLIGPSGAGKTALTKLVLGLRRAHGGVVRLDGLDVQQWPAAQRAGRVGWLPQDATLVGATVAQALHGGLPVEGDAAMARVVAAARLAGLHDALMRLPQGYQTPLHLGDGLPAGLRQQVALARAVLGDPRLVVLDEPATHLDGPGVMALDALLAALKDRGCTVLLVSQRPALMRHADALAVLQGGALVVHGPRDQVLRQLSAPNVHPLRPAADQAGPAPAAQAS